MDKIDLNKISTFTSEDGAEIVAHDPITQRLFVTTGDTVEIIDISDPANPTKVKDIEISGGGSNSVAVNNGIVAVAVEADTAQDNGVVEFYNADGEIQASVTVGALPDMLTFTPDGTKVIVANEGEPNDDYTVDPNGSISIVDISAGVANATVTTAGFTAFNDRKQELIEKGVRIYGPNATVAQDLEPEYIAVSPDGLTAFVTLQENNAVAVVDIESATVKDVLPLGYKDHSRGQPTLTQYEFPSLPVLGTTATENPEDSTQTTAGQDILLGGLSGLFYEGTANNGNLKFVTVPDRGPNGNSADVDGDGGNERPFALPDYQARVVKFELNESTGVIENLSEVLLTREDGTTPITGRPNIPGVDEEPVDLFGNELGYDEFGADLEGVVIAPNGNYWMVDEYRPAIYNFDATGKLINRFVAEGTGDLAGAAAGTFGTETLPAEYSSRRPNRGFEAVALDTDESILYAFIQTPLANPDRATSNASDIIRVLGIDPTSGEPVAEYAYLLEDPAAGVRPGGRVDKIGDAIYAGDGKFYVIERDSEVGADANKFIFDTNLQGATNLLNSYFVNVNSSASGAEFDLNLQLQTDDGNNVLNFGFSSESQLVLGLITNSLPEDIFTSVNQDGSISGSVAVDDSLEFTQAVAALMTVEPGETIDTSGLEFLLSNLFSEDVSDNPFFANIFDGVSVSRATLEQFSADDLAALGVNAVNKTKVTNLPSIGYQAGDKPEGLALLDDGRLAVLNDNDFGLLDEDIPVDGTVPVNPNPTPVVLGIIEFDGGNQLDASNEDEGINIKNHPILGMYQPDAIDSFEVDGKTYYITANEGDARDYDGFSEEVRVKDLLLDSTAYPNAAILQADENLGRLNSTTEMGDTDEDGDVDQIFSYGGRSFSIWDEFGNQVFDSGDQIARILESQTPELFNANDGIAEEFDERSDDKGAEPESVTVGTIDGKPYAFVGLERAGGGVLVYELSNPTAPKFNQYIRTEGDIAPEGLQFIAAEDSPNGEPMLAVANEESQTTTLYEIASLKASGENGIFTTDIDGTTVELIDLRGFDNQATVTVDFTISREADFNNEVYFYAVDDITGTVDGIAVGEAGYMETALSNLVSQVFSTSDDNTESGSIEFDAGSIVVPLIIADGTLTEALNGEAEVYFSYIGANSNGDNFDHIKLLNSDTFGFEDLPNGGDKDFNDIVIKIENIA
ncbi:MAG: choice-of-anchor I family protein [Rivularia sp. (in: cyanobacteria)]